MVNIGMTIKHDQKFSYPYVIEMANIDVVYKTFNEKN